MPWIIQKSAGTALVGSERDQLVDGGVLADAVLTLDIEGCILSCVVSPSHKEFFGAAGIVGRHLSELYALDAADLWSPGGALATAATDGTYAESSWLACPDGSRFWADTVVVATRDSLSRLVGYSAVISDLTRHRRFGERLRAVSEVTESIFEDAAGEDVLKLIARRVQESVGARKTTMVALDRHRTPTVLAVADGDHEPAPDYVEPANEATNPGRSRVPSGTPAGGLDVPLTLRGRTVGVIKVASRLDGHPFTAEDLATVELFAAPAAWAVERVRVHEDLRHVAGTAVGGQHSLRQTLDSLAVGVEERTGSLHCAIDVFESDGIPPPHHAPRPSQGDGVVRLPLICQGREIGELCCRYPAGRLRESDIAFLTLVAGRAAAAVETDRHLEAVREHAARDERQRLSRDLHDTVLQSLYGITTGARTARDLLARDAARAAEPIDYVSRLSDVGLAELREVLRGLRSDELEPRGLAATLAERAHELESRYGIAVEAVLEREPKATPEAKHALDLIARESLHNIVKHSGARSVILRLFTAPGSVTLIVTDDGVGFDPKNAPPDHLGLRSMRERAAEVGGAVMVDSRPDHGTSVLATVPRAEDGGTDSHGRTPRNG